MEYQPYGNHYIGFPEDVKEEIDNLEELGFGKVTLWRVLKSKQSESIKDPLETFAEKVMK